MKEWYANDPITEAASKAASTDNWYANDPIVKAAAPDSTSVAPWTGTSITVNNPNAVYAPPADPNYKPEVPLMGAGPDGSDIAPSKLFFGPGYIGPQPVDEATPTGTRIGIMAANAVGKNLTSMVTGIPDLALAVPQLSQNIMDKFRGKDTPLTSNLFPLTNAAFSKGAAVEKALGVPDVTPQTWQEKLFTNALMYSSGALVPDAALVGGVKALAPVADAVGATGMAEKMADPLVNYPRVFTNARVQKAATERAQLNPSLVGAAQDFLAPTAAKLAAGAGAGGAATLAEEQAPDSPMAAVIAALLGAHAGPKLAELAKGTATAPVATFSRLAQGIKLEPAFAQGVNSLLLPHRASNVDAAARNVQEGASDLPKALVNLKQGLKDSAGDSVPQTGANLSADPGLIRMEKGARLSNPETGKLFVARDQALAQQNANTFKQLAPAETGNKQFTVNTLAAQMQKVKDDAAASVAAEQATRDSVQNQGEAAVLKAKQDVIDAKNQAADAAQDISATPRMPIEQAGNSLVKDVLLPNKQAQVQQYRSMIAPFENDTRTPIDTNAARPAVDKVNSDIATGVDVGPDKALIDSATKILASNDRTGINAQVLAHTRQSNPAELLQLEQKLNQASRDAKAAGRGASVSALNTVRQGVNDVLDSAGLGEDFKNSRTFYRKNVAEPFQHAYVGDVLAPGANGEQFKNAPSTATSAFFKPGPEGEDSMKQLISAGGGVDAIRPQIQSHVAENMVDKFYNPNDSSFNTKRMRQYMVQHRQALDQIPDIRDDWNRMANQLDSGKNLRDVAVKNALDVGQETNQNLRLAQDRVRQVQAEAAQKVADDQKTAVKFYLNDPDPDKAIAKVFSASNNPAKDLADLRVRAEKDPSGKALLGLKEAIYDHLASKLEKAQPILGSKDSEILPSDMKTLKGYQKILTDAGVYSARDNEILDTLHRRIEVAGRSRSGQAVAGSSTAENSVLSAEQKAIVRSGLRGWFGGMEGGNKYSIVKDALSILTGQDQKVRAVENIKRQALLDPQLLLLLATRDLSKDQESLFTTKINRVLTNRTALAYTQGDTQNGK